MAFVHLLEYMGDDESIAKAARISYETSKSSSETLIRYLMRNNHTSPFEMVEFKFHIKCPIFVARQWMRHRTASINEISARYSVIHEEYWVPDEYRSQGSINKQGSGEPLEEFTSTEQKTSCEFAFQVYKNLIGQGVSRELARAHLPQSTYTEFIWKINLHNLLHFLKLRMDHHAQPEIQKLAAGIFKEIQDIVPLTCKAFDDYKIRAVTFSFLDIIAFRTGDTSGMGKSEREEFELKKKILCE